MGKGEFMEDMDPMEEMGRAEETEAAYEEEPIRIYQGLEEALEGLPMTARKVMDFLQEQHPEQVIVMLGKGTLRELLLKRAKEAEDMFVREHRKMQDQAGVWGMGTLARIQAEEQIGTELRERIDSEILYRPLTF